MVYCLFILQIEQDIKKDETLLIFERVTEPVCKFGCPTSKIS